MRKYEIMFLGFLLILPFNSYAYTSNQDKQKEYEKQVDAYNDQIKKNIELQNETERLLKNSKLQQERMEKLLNRWEKQADRYDAILDKWEKGKK